MKKFAHFFEVDDYFVQLFIEKDNAFSKIRYKDSPIGVALQHNLYDYFRRFVFASQSRGSFFQRIAFQVRTYGLDHRLKFLVNKLIGSDKKQNLAGRVVFFADNFVPRILDDFLKVMSKMETSKVAFYTSDYRAYKYILRKKKGEYPVVLLNGKRNNKSSAFKKEAISDLEHYVNPVLAREFGSLAGKMSRIVKINLGILTDYYDLFEKQLEIERPAKIVLGSDGFSVSRVICFAAQKLKIETFVLQHGFIDSQNGYLPLIADNIFCWSNYEKKLFEKNGVSSHRVLVAGSPRFENEHWLKENDGIQAMDQLLFVICPGIPQDVYDQIDLITGINENLRIPYKILVRPHPYYKDLAISYFKSKKNHNNISLDDNSFLRSIQQSQLVIFGNVSTGVFEALGLNKSVYILSGTQNKFDIYGFPRIEKFVLLKGLNEGISSIKEFDILNSSIAEMSSFAKVKSSVVIANTLITSKKQAC